MSWAQALGIMLLHPYDSAFEGALVHAARFGEKRLPICVNGKTSSYYARRQYFFKFGPREQEGEGAWQGNLFGIYVGPSFLCIKSAFLIDGELEMRRELLNFSLAEDGRLEGALNEWAEFPPEPTAVEVEQVPPYSRRDLMALLERNTQ